MRDGVAQPFHVLRERREPDIRLVQLLAEHANVGPDGVDLQLLVGERLARHARLLVDARRDALDRLGERCEQLLQLLRLLLEHAYVGHHLLVLAIRSSVGGQGERRHE